MIALNPIDAIKIAMHYGARSKRVRTEIAAWLAIQGSYAKGIAQALANEDGPRVHRATA